VITIRCHLAIGSGVFCSDYVHCAPLFCQLLPNLELNTLLSKDATARAHAHAWALLQAARALVDGAVPTDDIGVHYNSSTGEIHVDQGGQGRFDLYYVDAQRWIVAETLPCGVCALLDLYLPILGSHVNPVMVAGHLGQSLDAKIATSTGDAFFVTGEENRKHLHCMRALCHAVLVGAQTAITDNPQLTTRAVSGPNPIRVVLDPAGRVEDDNALLRNAQAETWLVHNASADLSGVNDLPHVTRVVMSSDEKRLNLPDVLSELRSRGIQRLFVEGGGVTVTGMMTANCLNRLHMAVAPLLVGKGRPALQLPGALSMSAATRPPFKLYRMGEDVLWDFDLSGRAGGACEDESELASDTDGCVVEGVERLL